MFDHLNEQTTTPPNGNEAAETLNAEMQPVDDSRAHVDPERGVFITSRGDEIELSGKRLSSLMLERLANEGKPKIPRVEVTLMGKHKQLEANPDHPGYIAELKEWEGDMKIRSMRYVFVMGVKGEAPKAFIEEQQDWFPNATPTDWKYLWVSSLVPDSDIDVFIEAVVGQALPTEKGMAEAASKF